MPRSPAFFPPSEVPIPGRSFAKAVRTPPFSPVLIGARATRLAGIVGLLLLALSLCLAYVDFRDVQASRRISDLVFAENLAASTLLSTVKDAETGQRGFLLTGDPAYLQPYQDALSHVASDLAGLQQVAAPDVATHQRVSQIGVLVNSKLDELARMVGLAKSGHAEAALAHMRLGQGRRLMVALHQQVDLVRTDGRKRLASAQAGAESAGAWSAPAAAAILAGLLFAAVARTERRQRRIAAQALARREKFIRAFGLAPGMLRDVDGRITFWADGMQRLYGYSAEEAVGRISHELLRTVFPADLAEADAALLARGEWQGELLHRHRDGGTVTVMSRWVLHRDAMDGSLSVVEIDQDIGQLRRAETNLQLALDAAGLGTWQLNLGGDGRAAWDARTAAMLGLPEDEPASFERWASVVVPEDVARISGIVARMVDPADPLDAAMSETRVRHPDGQIVWLQSTGRAQFQPDPASPSGRSAVRLAGTIRDISAAKNAEIELQQSATLLRSIIETTPGVIYAKDTHGRMLVANAAALALIGKPWASVEGRTDLENLDDPVQAETVMLNDLRIMERGETEIVEEIVGGQNGHARVWLSTKSPMRGADGAVVGLVGMSVEITERKQQQRALEQSNAELIQAKQRAERATQAKSRFLAGMSHELRTPLNGILGYAELLAMEGGLTAQQALRVDAMRGAGQHLLQMINRVLDLSAIEAGQITVQASSVDLRDLADDCLTFVRPGAEAKRLALALDAAPEIPDRVDVDPTRLRQVLLNLLGNAVKFTASGGVTLRLRIAGSGDRLAIQVADTGRGVPAHRRGDLFQDFERLGVDAEAAVEGAGLGLAISARLVGLMGGRLAHADNPGDGSVFGFELPLARACEPRTAAPALRVLVVDDIAMNREITTSFLKAAGHLAVCAEDGAEAVDAARQNDFDLILMDLRMPAMGGLEATRRIRGLGGKRSAVPIIALTAESFAEQIEEALQAGMVAHLAKPFTQSDLLATVASVASGRAHGRPRPAAPLPVPSSAGLPVLDAAVFETNSVFLPAAALVSHLEDIVAGAEAVQRALHAEAAAQDGLALADGVHALAGSAGMLGFTRLTGAARHFERAARLQAAELASLGQDLTVALEASLVEMRRHLSAARQRLRDSAAKSEALSPSTGERVG